MPLDRNRFYVQESASWRHTNPFVATELALDSMFARDRARLRGAEVVPDRGLLRLQHQDNRSPAAKISRNVAGVQFVVSEPVRIR